MLRKILPCLFLLLSFWTAIAQEMEIDVDTQTGTAYDVAWNPDGTILAVASGYEITLFSADLQDVLAISDAEDAIAINLAWSPDGTQLASVGGYNHSEIRIWQWDEEASTLTLENTLDGFEGIDRRMRTRHQYVVAWHENTLVTLADDQQSKFQVWDMTTGELLVLWETDYRIPLRELVWSEDGTEIIAAGMDAEENYILYRLNVSFGKTTLISLMEDQPYIFTLSPDGQFIAIAYEDGKINIRDYDETVAELDGVEQPVALTWHDDSLAVLGYDTTLQLWDVASVNE